MANRGSRQALLAELGNILDKEYILASEEALKPFECDGLSVYRALPLVAVLPGNADEVQAVDVCATDSKYPLLHVVQVRACPPVPNLIHKESCWSCPVWTRSRISTQ